MRKILTLLMLFIILSCSFSKEELEENIKEDVEREMKKQNRSVEVKSVKLTKKNEKEYVGIAVVLEDEFERSYNLKVFVDGESYSTDFQEIREWLKTVANTSFHQWQGMGKSGKYAGEIKF